MNLQRGGGRQNPRFIIEEESVRLYKRFDMEGVEIKGKITTPPSNTHIFEWLNDALTHLYNHIIRNRR